VRRIPRALEWFTSNAARAVYRISYAMSSLFEKNYPFFIFRKCLFIQLVNQSWFIAGKHREIAWFDRGEKISIYASSILKHNS